MMMFPELDALIDEERITIEKVRVIPDRHTGRKGEAKAP